MTTPFKWGAEFLVNTTTAGGQVGSSVTGFADGRFLVSWLDASFSGAFHQQVYAATGAKIGTELTVTPTAEKSGAAVAVLTDGGFVRTWINGGDRTVVAQIVNADGSVRVAEFTVNTAAPVFFEEPKVAVLADGGFVIIFGGYASTGGDTSFNSIHGQRYGADGQPVGLEFLVNTTTAQFQEEPTVTALSTGGFVVAWTDFSAGDKEIRMQLYAANGARVGTEVVAEAVAGHYMERPSVSEIADGRFVLSWTDANLSANIDVRAQVFNANGSKAGDVFLLNTTAPADQAAPVIHGLADGRIVAVWQDNSATGGDNSGNSIKAQVFQADGTKSGLEFLVNTTVSGEQTRPEVAELADGRIAITWTDSSSGNTDIRGQIFDPRIAAVALNGTLAADDLVGTIFGDYLGGGFGNDSLRGERGNDRIYGGAGLDALTGGNGGDLLFGGDGDDKLHGGNGSDVLDGGAGNDSLDGGLGLDLMIGGAGNDRFTLSDLGDVVQEAALGGIDTVMTGVFSVNLAHYAQVETVVLTGLLELEAFGTAAANTLVGNAAANVLEGGGGNDSLSGGGGLDQLFGDAGLDSLYGGLGNDVLNGGAQKDQLFGGDGDDDLSGGSGNDLVSGGNGKDTLMGDDTGLPGSGNDTLSGGAGNDVLNGFTGVDVMFGGAGADTFQFFLGYGKDRVMDFADGSDKVDLRAWAFANAADARTHFADIGGKLVFTMGSDVMTIDHMTKALFTSADMIL